jgi:hypothetical protein
MLFQHRGHNSHVNCSKLRDNSYIFANPSLLRRSNRFPLRARLSVLVGELPSTVA